MMSTRRRFEPTGPRGAAPRRRCALGLALAAVFAVACGDADGGPVSFDAGSAAPRTDGGGSPADGGGPRTDGGGPRTDGGPGSTPDASAGGRCGDGAIDEGEWCDDGTDNGTPGRCNGSCAGVTPVVEGDLVVHYPRLVGDLSPTHLRILLVLVDAVGGLEDDPRTEVLEMVEPGLLGELFFSHPDGTGAFYREASYGRVSLSGSVVGWLEARDGEVSASQMFEDRDRYFELATPYIDYADYDVVALVGKAHSGARQTGWRLGNTVTVSEGRFQVGIMFMINSTVLPATTDRRYGGTILPAKPWPHELGHTLGLGHATSIWCEDAVFCDDFEVRPYGDVFSYMGAGEYGSHPDVLQKLRLGWLDEDQVPELAPGVDREIVIYPLATPAGRVKGARIRLATPRMDRDVLAIEYRTPVGFDRYLDRLHDEDFTGIFTSAPIDSVGFQLRVSRSDALGEATSLLDPHPSTPYNPDRGVYTNGNPGRMADAFLNVGESFSDPVDGFTLTNRGLSEDGGMILAVTWASSDR
jgi:hypothetical protein